MNTTVEQYQLCSLINPCRFDRDGSMVFYFSWLLFIGVPFWTGSLLPGRDRSFSFFGLSSFMFFQSKKYHGHQSHSLKTTISFTFRTYSRTLCDFVWFALCDFYLLDASKAAARFLFLRKIGNLEGTVVEHPDRGWQLCQYTTRRSRSKFEKKISASLTVRRGKRHGI